MSMDRLNQLEEFYKDDPRDPFNIYALALEYQNHDPSRSQALFNMLLLDHENYVPTYYHAAKLAEKQGDYATARKIYEKGMEQCRKLNETKALRELKSAYEELLAD